MSLVGKIAPDFTATAVFGDNTFKEINFKESIKDKITLLFFWPADFSFICPTEIIAFDNRLKEFEERGVLVFGASLDSQYVHYAWKNTQREQGGIVNIKFPIIADSLGAISKSYGILAPSKLSFRATFIIDQNGYIVHESVNEMSIGRNIDEYLRIIDALKFSQEHGEVCPANWKKGQETLKTTSESVADFLKKHSNEL
ncbi:MAG: peroxiredoxin [Rickettsiales bacterium]|jgi:peroxiredoxin (alkyl hydroperoxide reductase subunit C)|nr:peroxiredoxin [Rickettsiales bacterium]